MRTIRIAGDFAVNPGARYRTDGPKSGQEFRETMLEPHFITARETGELLCVDLDGTEGYATSFLEEAFGGLARKYGTAAVLKILRLISLEEPDLADEVLSYVREANET